MTEFADALATAIPPLVDPVKDIMSIPTWLDIASPTTGPRPLTKLNTPLGTPASWKISAITIEDSGAISLGFNTAVHPEAKHGANFETT